MEAAVSEDPSFALLKPVREGNAFEETVERLLQAIRLGVFPAGTRLPAERDLAKHLRVSRVTLREALSELQKAGMLQIQRGRYGGAVVQQAPAATTPTELPSAAVVEDVLVFRSIVEPAAAELAAASHLAPDGRRHLSDAYNAVVAAPVDQYRPLDARFHIAVAELSGHPTLVDAVATARARTSDLLDRIPMLPANLEHSNQQHRDIVDAILGGDPERARSAMLEHLEGTASLLRGFLTDGESSA